MFFFTSRPVSGFMMVVGGFFQLFDDPIWIVVFEKYLVEAIISLARILEVEHTI